jgi:hypothetical protein
MIKHPGHLICIRHLHTPEGYDCLMKYQQYVSRGYELDDQGHLTVLLVGMYTHCVNAKGYEIGYNRDRFRGLESLRNENLKG